MSSIDKRIVEMSFENKNFEDRIQESSKSLKNFSEALEKSGNGSALSGLQSIAEGVGKKFSALETIAVGALIKIGQQAVVAGQQLLKSLTLDKVTAGFHEYELKINSIKVMLASGRTKEGLPVTLDMVNRQLELLNQYADQTIYSFSDMTSNIGKFTNAGVDLETSVAAIKGIANAAALSGANSEEASRAMYNFAQALSAGYVKLIDWKSIENANMATVEFKTQLLEAAVAAGTLEKGADGMYNVINAKGKAGNLPISATKNFNDSLQQQWMTTEVLTKTLNDYADATTDIGKRATEAATKVRTFSQLLDTLKEGIGSGWAMTFEHIIGDYDEATELWSSISDAIGGFVNRSSEARNAMLKDWKELGGRTALLNGFGEAINKVGEFLKPIRDAFSEAFPAVTGLKLAKMSREFEKFIAKLQPYPKTLHQLKQIFKGVFDALSLGWKIVSSVFKGIFDGIGKILPKGDGLMKFLAKLGLSFTKLNSDAKKAEIFKKISKTIADAFGWLAEKINVVKDALQNSKFISGIIEGFKNTFSKWPKNFGGFDGFSKIFEKVKDLFVKWPKSSGGFDGFMEKLGTFAREVGTVLKPVFGWLGEAFIKIKEAISGVWKTEGITGLLDILTTFLQGGVLLSIKKLFDTFSGIGDSAGGMGKGVVELFGGLKDSLVSWQNSLKSKELMNIAIAVGILTTAVIALAAVDPEKLTNASVSMGLLFTELIVAFNQLQKTTAGSGMKKVGSELVMFAASILLLSISLGKIADIPSEKLGTAILALSAILLELIVVAKALADTKGFAAAAFSLIEMAVAIRLVVVSVEKLGNIDADKLKQGLLAVGAISVGMIAVATLIGQYSKGGNLIAAGIGLQAIAVAILMIVGSVALLGMIDAEKLKQGLIAVGAIGAGMAIFAVAISQLAKGGDLILAGIALQGIAVALLMMVGSVSILAKLDVDKLQSALFGLGVILAEILLFSIGISELVKPGKLIAASVALNLMAVALLAISSVVTKLGAMKMEELGRGLLGLAGTLAIMTVAMIAVSDPKVLVGAAAMVVMAGAIRIFTPAIEKLGAMSLGEIAKALLALAGVFVVIGVAATVLGPLIGTILGLAGAIALLGLGMVGIGAGLMLFSTGLAALAAGGTAAISMLVIAIKEIVKLIPFILTQVGAGIVALANVIILGAPAIAGAIAAVAEALLVVLGTQIPKLLTVIFDFISQLLVILVEKVPEFVDAGMKIIFGLLKGISDNIQSIVETIIQMLINILAAIANKIPDLIVSGISIITAVLEGIGQAVPQVVDAAFNMVIDFINGMADSIRTNTPLLLEAIANLCTAFIDGILTFFGISGGTSTEGQSIAMSILQGIIDGIIGGAKGVVDAIVGVGEKMLGGFKKLFNINSPSKVMADLGGNLIDGLDEGVRKKNVSAVKSTDDILGKMVELIKTYIPKFKLKGQELVLSLISGLSSKLNNAKQAVTAIINAMVQLFDDKKTTFNQKGMAITDAIANGIKDLIKVAIARGAINTVLTAVIENITDKLINFEKKGKEIIDNIVLGMENKEQLAKIKKAAGDLMDEIIKQMSSYINVERTRSMGESIGQGIIDGIRSKSYAIVSAGSQLAQDLIAAVKRILQIKSPSKVMEGIGRYMDEGLAEGIRKHANLAVSKVEDLGKDSVQNLSNILNGIGNAIDSDINLSPVISPVLDLNGMRTGAGLLNKILSNGQTYGLAASKVSLDRTIQTNQNGSQKVAGDQIVKNEFNLYGLTVREEADIDKIASKLYQKQENAMRSRGFKPNFV